MRVVLRTSDQKTVFYSWPELDLTDKSASLDEHLEKIENLVEVICNGEVVIESKYTNSKETDMTLNHWNGFLLKLFIHQKLIQLKMIKEIFKKHDPPSISREVLEGIFTDLYNLVPIIFTTSADNDSKFPQYFCCQKRLHIVRNDRIQMSKQSFREIIETLILLSALTILVKKVLDNGLAVEYLKRVIGNRVNLTLPCVFFIFH